MSRTLARIDTAFAEAVVAWEFDRAAGWLAVARWHRRTFRPGFGGLRRVAAQLRVDAPGGHPRPHRRGSSLRRSPRRPCG